MYHFPISDQLYQSILRRASADGFDDVANYLTGILEQEFAEPENFDHLFTPERLAKIDAAVAQVEAGQVVSSEELREHFRRKFNS